MNIGIKTAMLLRIVEKTGIPGDILAEWLGLDETYIYEWKEILDNYPFWPIEEERVNQWLGRLLSEYPEIFYEIFDFYMRTSPAYKDRYNNRYSSVFPST